MERQGMNELHKIKWSGETIIGDSQILHRLFIKWDTNYHVTTWCEMQTCIWMAYSDSMHFSDKSSYKILLISSYGLKDINYARFKYLQEFLEKNSKPGRTCAREATDSNCRAPATGCSGRIWAEAQQRRQIWTKRKKGGWLVAWTEIRTRNLQIEDKGENQLGWTGFVICRRRCPFWTDVMWEPAPNELL
jgi:hypothetical protein